MPGKDGGKAKPLKAPKKGSKDYDESDVEFLKKKKEEAAALKAAKEALAKGKKKRRRQRMAAEGGGSTSSAAAAAASQQAPPREERQQEAAPQDCLQCRVVGTGVCLAASAYLAASNYAAPVGTGRAHRAVMLFAAGGFLALGIARAVL